MGAPSVTVEYGTGLIPGRATEASARFTSERLRLGQHRQVVDSPGFGGAVLDALPRTANNFPWPLSERGFATIVPDLGGTSTWGNDDSIDAVSDAVDYMKASGLGKADKVCLVGESMGTVELHNYTIANPENVSALILVLFVADMRDVHADVPAAAAGIEAAYPDWSAAMSTHNPIQMTAQAAAADVPVHIWSSQSDNTCEWEFAVQYRDAVNAINPGQVSLVDIDQQAPWNPTGTPMGHSYTYLDIWAAVEEFWRLGALA